MNRGKIHIWKVIFQAVTVISLLGSGMSVGRPGTPAYDAGYKRGHELGVNQGKKGYGMPNDLAISVMAKNHCEDLKFKGSPECEAGFAKGFEDGYRSKKPFKRRAEDYEKLSWNNARIGTELYDYNEVLEAKITAVDRQKGIITVKYTRGGIIEPKQLEAVVNFWYVKKVSPAKK